MKRRLSLRRDHLGALTSDELTLVAGGTHVSCGCGDLTFYYCTWTCPTQPLGRCLSDLLCYWTEDR